MRYTASIQLEITVPDDQAHPESWAADAIAEAMRELCMDASSGITEWAYVETASGRQFTHPKPGNLDKYRFN